MKAFAICAIAAILATAVSAAADDLCVFDVTYGNTVEQVNLTGASYANNGITIGKSSYKIFLSPCAPALLVDNCTGYAWVGKNKGTCFKNPPTRQQYNSTTNATAFEFVGTTTFHSMLAKLLGEDITTLSTQMSCGETEALTLEPGMSSVANGKMSLAFSTSRACPAPLPSVEPTPAPISGGDDDDDSGLSTWEIVGIIVGCVVFVVVVVFVIFQCRRSDQQAEGQYSRV